MLNYQNVQMFAFFLKVLLNLKCFSLVRTKGGICCLGGQGPGSLAGCRRKVDFSVHFWIQPVMTGNN